jgi:hypothetical protein
MTWETHKSSTNFVNQDTVFRQNPFGKEKPQILEMSD